MKKIGIFILMISIFGTTFFISNKLSAQVEPLEPLPTKPLTPIKSSQSSQTVSSNLSGGRGPFAGIISNTKANEIEYLENSGYNCYELGGTTIEIKKTNPKYKFSTRYFVPNYVNSRYPIAKGKSILGIYEGTTKITCVHIDGQVKIVTLSTIKNYGVSRGVIGSSRLSEIAK